jgi:putative endonuclease
MREERHPCVYILASEPRGTLYIGVTSNLPGRLWQHRSNALPGFTSKHSIHLLVHFEMCADMERAIAREKQLKRWHRSWKLNLIETLNPHWTDLAVGLGVPAIGPSHDAPGP